MASQPIPTTRIPIVYPQCTGLSARAKNHFLLGLVDRTQQVLRQRRSHHVLSNGTVLYTGQPLVVRERAA